MALTESAVIEALRPVNDPELGRSIVELDMVRQVAIAGPTVTVGVDLTVAGCPCGPRSTGPSPPPSRPSTGSATWWWSSA